MDTLLFLLFDLVGNKVPAFSGSFKFGGFKKALGNGENVSRVPGSVPLERCA